MRRDMLIDSPSMIVNSSQVGMLQGDLVDHSGLSDTMSPGLVMGAKIQLARDLEHHLQSWRLKRIIWAGDGGIFGIKCRKEADFDAVIHGGELVFRVLNSVNEIYAKRFPAGRKLILRVSGHFGSILTVPQTRFWHGSELNFFAKHERELSEPGMFAITGHLRDMLSQGQREKFPDDRRVIKSIGAKEIELFFHESYGDMARLRGIYRLSPQRKSASSVKRSAAARFQSGKAL